jgi:hypothetical protein
MFAPPSWPQARLLALAMATAAATPTKTLISFNESGRPDAPLTGGPPKFFLERLGPLNGPKMTKKENKQT